MTDEDRPTKILIVDDDTGTADSLRLLLGEHEFATETAGALSTAAARLREGAVDCVILDLTLPDAHDLEAVRALQALHPEVPLIVHTGFPDLVVPSVQAGAVDVVLKPGVPEEWEHRIRKAIELHKVRRKYQPIMDAMVSAKAIADAMVQDSVTADSWIRRPGRT